MAFTLRSKKGRQGLGWGHPFSAAKPSCDRRFGLDISHFSGLGFLTRGADSCERRKSAKQALCKSSLRCTNSDFELERGCMAQHWTSAGNSLKEATFLGLTWSSCSQAANLLPETSRPI
eukprot:s140_g18.t2